MRDDGTENTSQISGSESDSQLHSLRVFVLWLSEDLGVEELDDLFESDELDDGVWNLSSPEWSESLEESRRTSLSANFAVGSSEFEGESSSLGGLDLELDGLKWAEESISDNLSTSGGNRPTDSSVLDGVLISNDLLVDILEDFVESEFSQSLEGVSNQSWGPSGDQSSLGVENSVLFSHDGQSFSQGLVESGVDLSSALDDIEWGNGSVSQSAGQKSSNHTFKVVRSVVDVRHD